MSERLRRKQNVLLTICRGIVANDRMRKFAPLDVEMLEAELANYHRIQEAVAKEIANG